MTWTEAFLAVAVGGNVGVGLFSWRIAWRLRGDMRAVRGLHMLLTNIAARQFENAAMGTNGWRAWAGTMGTIHVRFMAGQDENATEAEDG